MPKIKLNDEGQVVNEDGTPFEMDGEAVTIEGAFTKAQVTQTVEDRLAREKKNLETLRAAAEQNPALQKLVDETTAKARELENELERVKAESAQESAAQINKYRQEADKFRTEAQQRAEELVRYQVQVQIMSAAGSDFIDPGNDIVPKLLQAHKREPVKGEDGRPTGEFKDFFKLRFKNDKGEESEDYLPVDKAIGVIAQQYPHYVKATGASGSGGGTYRTTHGNPKRSDLSSAQKSAFVREHGIEAFQSLPE